MTTENTSTYPPRRTWNLPGLLPRAWSLAPASVDAMSDPRIDRWRLHGKVFLWRFPEETRNYPGWDCTADREGCRSLLDLLSRMAASPYSSIKHILISKPTEGYPAALVEDRRWRSPDKLRLAYPRGKVADDAWRWEGPMDSPKLTVGRSKLEEMRRAFESVAAGRGDFCIHAEDAKLHGLDPEKMAIWFW